MIKRIAGWLVLVPLCVVLAVFALANRQVVAVHFDPLSPQSPLLPNLEIPLFILIYAMLIVGILLGGIAVWLSQGKHRREKRRWRREAENLERQVETARRAPAQKTDTRNLLATDDMLEME